MTPARLGRPTRRAGIGAHSAAVPGQPSFVSRGAVADRARAVVSGGHTDGVLVDDFLPAYDVSDSVPTVVDANPQTVWDALMAVDLIEVGRRKPLVGVLGVLRMLPELASDLLHGERPPAAPERLRLRETAEAPADQGGWVLLGERAADEIALGLVGKFWRPVISYVAVTAEQFRDFAEPGYVKTLYSLSVHPLAKGGSLLSGVMRTATTDEHARRWFHRYWTLGVGSGAHVLVAGVLELTREDAERRAGSGQQPTE